MTEENPKQAGKDSSHSGVDRNMLEAVRLLAASQLQDAFLKIKAAIGQQPVNADGLRILGKIFGAIGHAREADAAFGANLEINTAAAIIWTPIRLIAAKNGLGSCLWLWIRSRGFLVG